MLWISDTNKVFLLHLFLNIIKMINSCMNLSLVSRDSLPNALIVRSCFIIFLVFPLEVCIML